MHTRKWLNEAVCTPAREKHRWRANDVQGRAGARSSVTNDGKTEQQFRSVSEMGVSTFFKEQVNRLSFRETYTAGIVVTH